MNRATCSKAWSGQDESQNSSPSRLEQVTVPTKGSRVSWGHSQFSQILQATWKWWKRPCCNQAKWECEKIPSGVEHVKILAQHLTWLYILALLESRERAAFYECGMILSVGGSFAQASCKKTAHFPGGERRQCSCWKHSFVTSKWSQISKINYQDHKAH